MTATLQPATFPFCAVIAPAASNSISVLQQMEGPVDPSELVEILQRTIEEQGSAFGPIGCEKNKMLHISLLYRETKKRKILGPSKPRQSSITQGKDTQILIRFPSSATREQSFSSTDKILSVYRYIDSLGLSGIGNYRLISSFPERVTTGWSVSSSKPVRGASLTGLNY